MLEIGKTLIRLLDSHDRRSFFIYTVISFVAGIIEVVGIGSIMPFIGVLLQPSLVTENPILFGVYSMLGFTSTNMFIIFMGLTTIGLITLGGITNIFCVRYQLRMSYMTGHKWAVRLLSAYLSQPYKFFLRQNTNTIKAIVLSDVDRVVSALLLPFGAIIARSFVIMLLVILLLLVNPAVTLSLVGITGGIYGALLLYFKKKMKTKGALALLQNSIRFKSANDALSCIREIKLHGNASFFTDNFEKASGSFASLQAYSLYHGQIPRFVIEIIGFVILITILLYFLVSGKANTGDIIPLVALFAASGYKILPAAQNLYSSINSIRFNTSALETVAAGMALEIYEDQITDNNKKIDFLKEIKIEDLSFAYEGADTYTIHDINISIQKNSMVGIVGPTGAGKSTLIDILIGLLPPQKGKISIDATTLSPDHIRAWQRKIGYVPQQVQLLEGTAAYNIAFASDPGKIDKERMIRAATAACMNDFISEDKNGFDLEVGEEGTRLSGGQKQRLGIARALYLEPEVIVLDEPTSALDKETAKAIITSLKSLSHEKTIIIITHNLEVLNFCDQIVFVNNGTVKSAATVDEIIAEDKSFSTFVGQE